MLHLALKVHLSENPAAKLEVARGAFNPMRLACRFQVVISFETPDLHDVGLSNSSPCSDISSFALRCL